jgi:peroxiredoxin
MNAPSIPASGTRRPARPRAQLANLAVVTVTAAAILALAYLSNQPSPAAPGFTPVEVAGGLGAGKGPLVGETAPDFKATTDAGNAFQLSAFAGKPIWLTFGASWCQPSRAENPDIQAAWDRYRERGLVLAQVFYTEDKATVTTYADTVGLTYTRIPDPDSRLAGAYRILGIPTHFFIDRTGAVHRIVSSTLDQKTIDAALREIMG